MKHVILCKMVSKSKLRLKPPIFGTCMKVKIVVLIE